MGLRSDDEGGYQRGYAEEAAKADAATIKDLQQKLREIQQGGPSPRAGDKIMKLEESHIVKLEATGEVVAKITVRSPNMQGILSLLAQLEGVPLVAGVAPQRNATPVEQAAADEASGKNKAKMQAPVTQTVTPPKAAPAATAAPKPAPVVAPTPAPAQTAPAPTPAPAPAAVVTDGPAPPAELLQATSFRQVMQWMIANGFTEKDAVAAKCEEFRKTVPAITRLGDGDHGDRIGRALEVLMAEKSVASNAQA